MFRKKIQTEFSKCVMAKPIHVTSKIFISINEIQFQVIDKNFAGFGKIESKAIVMIKDNLIKLFSEDESITIKSLKENIPELDLYIRSKTWR